MPDLILQPTAPTIEADRAAYHERFPEAAPQPVTAPAADAPAPVQPAPAAAVHAVAEVTQQFISADPLAEIDKLVAARGEAQATVRQPGQRISYNTHTGELRVGDTLVDPATATGASGELVDDGTDLEKSHAAALAKFQTLADEFDAITGYDVKGEPIYVVSDPAARANMARRLETMRTSLTWQAERYHALAAQREARAAEAERAQREDYARRQWIGGDPRRAEMLREEIERAEARTIAEGVVASRRGKL